MKMRACMIYRNLLEEVTMNTRLHEFVACHGVACEHCSQDRPTIRFYFKAPSHIPNATMRIRDTKASVTFSDSKKAHKLDLADPDFAIKLVELIDGHSVKMIKQKIKSTNNELKTLKQRLMEYDEERTYKLIDGKMTIVASNGKRRKRKYGR